MNLVTLLDRTLRLGYWGSSTLFHMAIGMLAGLLLLLFPEEISQFILEDGVVGTSAGEARVLMTPVVAYTVARVVGFHLVAVGLLFGLFGSVADRKARMRLNYFAMLVYVGGITSGGLQLYLRTGLLRRDVLVTSILVDTVGLGLTLVCLYYLTVGSTPDPVVASSENNNKKKK